MRVAVIGGGVAGSASAIAMRHIGAEVTVYERHADPAGPVGSFVSLAVNGLRALDRLGCLGEVQEAGFPVAMQRMWSGKGKLLGEVARGRRSADPLMSVTLLRADLVAALRAQASRLGVEIITGRPVTRAELNADLVIGADGMWSQTRSWLDQGAPRPRYAGIYTVSGVSRAVAGLPDDGFNWVFAHHGVFIYLPAPDGRIWWTAQVCASRPPDRPIDADLRAIFRREPHVAAILDSKVDLRAVTLLHKLAPITLRHNGNTVLVGDAAHPAGAGQGASMALEDAVVLGQQLSTSDGVVSALAAFDALRQERAGKLAKMEASSRDAKTAGPIAARLRELFLPLVFSRFYENATGWLYDYELGDLRVDDELCKSPASVVS